MNKLGSFLKNSCLVLGVLVAVIAPVQAQIEEIVVTPQKRVESLKDVPISIDGTVG